MLSHGIGPSMPGLSFTVITDREGYRIRAMAQNVSHNVSQGLPLAARLFQALFPSEHREVSS